MKNKEKAEQQNMELAMQEEETFWPQEFRPLKDLNLIDDYMFDIATTDLEICKSIVELSLNIHIQEIRWKEGQKVIHNLPGKRGIRLDFYVRDTDGRVFNVEMQKKNSGNLPMRTRFYSALLDAPLLKHGEKQFDGLPETYIIVICGFDLFGEGKYRYRFRYHCEEDWNIVLQNGLNIVFLNTRGRNGADVEPELAAFLRFVENSTAEEARQSEDPRIQQLYGKINTLKNSEAVEVDYMTAEEYKRWLEETSMKRGMERGMKKGMEKGIRIGEMQNLIRLVIRKLEKGCTPEQIAELLEEEPEKIQRICEAAGSMAPEYSVEKICDQITGDAEKYKAE